MRKHYIKINADGTYELIETDAPSMDVVYQPITQVQFDAIVTFHKTNATNYQRFRIDPKTLIPFLAP